MQFHRHLEELERKITALKATFGNSQHDPGTDQIVAPRPYAVANGLPHAPYLDNVDAEVVMEESSKYKELLTAPNVQAHTPSQSDPDRGPAVEPAGDLTDTNLHTNNIEFYGGSSSIAFLRQVQSNCDDKTKAPDSGESRASLVSMLHNTDFSPISNPHCSATQEIGQVDQDRFYFRVSRKFMEGYFESIHYIQPLLEREEFTARCESLWFGEAQNQPSTFHALYYSVLSLGALVRAWDEGPLYGLTRFQWSRRLFEEARLVLNKLGTATDLEMVQCLFLMVRLRHVWCTTR